MSDVFDIYTLLFLVLAVVIFLRLRAVLGRRTGHERPPFNPYADKSVDTSKPGTDMVDANVSDSDNTAKDTDNIVTLPKRENDRAVAASRRNWSTLLTKGEAAKTGLSELVDAVPNFDPKTFIDGAKTAYEMIVMAFANGDRKTLKTLLSKDVFDGFAQAIADREARGEKVETTFIGIDDARIADAALKGRIANLTLEVQSKLITATFGKDGDVIDGDRETIVDVTDIWTFSRDVSSRDPNWLLVATEASD